jgi:hypothetical protein
MDSYVKFNDELSDTEEQKRQNQSKKLKRSALILSLTIVFMSFIFMTSCYYTFYYPYTFTRVFEGVDVSSEYDLDHEVRLLPLIKVELAGKNFELRHRVLPHKNHTSLASNENRSIFSDWLKKIRLFFGALSSRNFLEYDYNDDSDLVIEQHQKKYEFKIEKVSLKVDPVECYNVSVRGDKPKLSDDEIEVCFNLNGNSWFGGHE